MSGTAAQRRMLERLKAAGIGRVVTPAEGEAARREIAAMIAKAHAAAEGGDRLALRQLERIFGGLAAIVRERPVPDELLVQELQAIADSYGAAQP